MNSKLLSVLVLILFTNESCKNSKGQQAQFLKLTKEKIEVMISDKSITLKSAAGDLTNCKPYLAWRNEGAKEWAQDNATSLSQEKISDTESKVICKVGPVLATIFIKQLADNMLEFSGTIKNEYDKVIEMARFHYLHGTLDNKQLNFVGNIPESFKLINKIDTMPAPRLEFEKFWKRMGPDYPMLANPIHDDVNWAVSKDIGIYTTAMNEPGWFVGFTGPGTAYGEVGFKTLEAQSPFFAGVLLDNTILEPDSTRTLEKFIVHSGDWQEGMRQWVILTATEFNVKPITHPLVGYCSWYQEGRAVTSKNIIRANNEFASMSSPSGGRTVQIDDGWQKMSGDWTPNAKFDSIWGALPKMLADKGTLPGLWLAPTSINKNHPIANAHPERLQQFSSGTLPTYFPSLGYFLDNDRPENKAHIKNIFKEKVSEGWRYFKIDFTYPLSTARVAYNRKKTQFESHRDLYKLIRDACGPDVLLNACIGSIDRYPIGSVNIDRIGGDIGGEWNTVQNNLRDLLSRSCTNGYWWQADADVFYMRDENTKLNSDENFLLTGSIGLIGGAFLTSDYVSQWDAEAKQAVDVFWTKEGPRVPYRHFVLYGNDNSIRAYLVSYNDGRVPAHRLGIYNWSAKAEDVSVSLSEVQLNPALTWSIVPFIHRPEMDFIKNEITIKDQPAHSIRIVDITLK